MNPASFLRRLLGGRQDGIDRRTRDLVALDRVALDPETVNNTLGVLLKYRDDLERIAGEEATRLVTEAKAAAAA